MTFFVRKALATGPIRFGVSPRRPLDTIDDDAGLSTGAAGEFLRKRGGGFFFADERNVGKPTLPLAQSISRVSFWKSLRGEGARSIGYLALLALGALFVLLGISVLFTKGKEGWVEIILGIIFIAIPIVLTAQKRKAIRVQEEKERAEREAREARERQMLSAYVTALDRLRRERSPEAIEEVRRERGNLELPYEIWSAAARRTVLTVGFEALSRLGVARANEVSRLMSDAASAAGLKAEEEVETKLDLYRSLVWHLLADDRVGDAQAHELKEVRKGFDIWDRDVPVEAKAAEEFKRLRGVTNKQLPREQCGVQLSFQEYCIHHARGKMLTAKKNQWIEGAPCDVYVTNRRVIVSAKKPIEVRLPLVDDVEVDVDLNVLSIRTADPKKPVIVRVEDPIYTASLIDIATTIDERPKGFA